MARQHRHQEPAEPSGGPLPESHWTVIGPVRWPGRPEDRIDEVIVGPSGVHVILHDRRHVPVDTEDFEAGAEADLAEPETIVRARAAAAAVGGQLPDRYRSALRAAVCLCETHDQGAVVGEVRLASPAPLRFAVRHQDRVLSTSEVAGVSRRLRLALVPYPAEVAATSSRRVHRIWRRLAAASLTAAAASTLLVAVGRGHLW